MKAAYIQEHGGVDKLIIGELDKPAIKADEVLIKVEYCALNRLDLFVRKGAPALKVPLPHVSGADFVGIIDECGADVTTLALGDRVVINAGWFCGTCENCVRGEQSLCLQFRMIGEHTWGGMAEFAAVPARCCYKVSTDDPRGIGAMTLTTLTAWRMLSSKAQLRPGQLLLIPGAGGGLSSAAIQIGKYLGATVIAVTSSTKKEELVRSLGADLVLNYKDNPEWNKDVWKFSKKRGVDVVFESVGEATWKDSLRSLKRGGILVTAGATTGFTGDTNIGLIFWKQLQIMGSTMANRREFEEAVELIQQGIVRPVIDREFSLDQIREAHQYLESGNHAGKVIIKIS